MEGGSVDLTRVAVQMLSTVPLWLFALAIYKSWVARSKEQKDMLEKRLLELGDMSRKNQVLIQESVSSFHEKLNRLEIRLAASGVDDLKANIETLKEKSTKAEMKLEAAWRMLDQMKKIAGGTHDPHG